MVCCVSSGSCDSPNVYVIYRPLNKQASLPQPVNVGPSATPKVESGDPQGPLRSPLGTPQQNERVLFDYYFIQEEITDRLRMSDQRFEALLSSSHKTRTDRQNSLYPWSFMTWGSMLWCQVQGKVHLKILKILFKVSQWLFGVFRLCFNFLPTGRNWVIHQTASNLFEENWFKTIELTATYTVHENSTQQG